MSQTDDETQVGLGELLECLKFEDPDCYMLLTSILDEWEHHTEKHLTRKKQMYNAYKRYINTEKGKLARKRANRNYYVKKQTNKSTVSTNGDNTVEHNESN